MAYYAKINPLNYIVQNVIEADQNFINSLPDKDFWLETSRQTIGGIHYTDNAPSTDQSQALRKNFATIGGKYDPELDAFYDKQPHPSWILNTETYIWESPILKPDDEKNYRWDETLYQQDNKQGWVIVPTE
jgi:hypothetical protein